MIETILMMRSYEFTYTNWKGEQKTRRAQFFRLEFGSNKYHPEPQFLLFGLDLDKNETRTYAAKDIKDIQLFGTIP